MRSHNLDMESMNESEVTKHYLYVQYKDMKELLSQKSHWSKCYSKGWCHGSIK